MKFWTFWPSMFVHKLYKKLCSFKVRIFVLVCILVFILLYRNVFSVPRAKIIPLHEIPLYLVKTVTNHSGFETIKEKSLCDIMPTISNGSWPLPNDNITDEYLEKLALETNVKLGGTWKPTFCLPQHHVAIVVPYRDRKMQLYKFLAHMHPFLQYQLIAYRIYIIEQTHQRPFNRAKLFNIGFKESEYLEPVQCYIFHDVDLLPLNVLNIYGCTKLPRHLSANIDVFDFKVPYDWIFGGAISIVKNQFKSANGFSNKFFGWGGEDDDFFNRVTRNRTSICRFEPEISKYVMLSHKKETPNEDRFYYLTTGERRFESDGLNSLRYSVKKIELRPLYTNILVDL